MCKIGIFTNENKIKLWFYLFLKSNFSFMKMHIDNFILNVASIKINIDIMFCIRYDSYIEGG